MLQTSRNFIRIFFLIIGFALFVIVSVRSASQVANRQLVVGKSFGWPITTLVAKGIYNATHQATVAAAPLLSTHENTPATHPAPSTTTGKAVGHGSTNAAATPANGNKAVTPSAAVSSTKQAVTAKTKDASTSLGAAVSHE